MISAAAAAAIISALFTGCGTGGNETAAPETGGQPTPTISGEVGQTPEVRDALPADLFGDALNVFSDVPFPEGYTVYAAGFENNADFYFYELYLTAEGKPENIIRDVSRMLGNDGEESLRQSIDAFGSDGGVGIDGRLDGVGFDVNCKITPTEEGDYDYDYVEGCNLRFRASIHDPSGYDKIIADNYNLHSLSAVANYFDVTPITGKSKIYVRRTHNNAQIDAVYNTVEDVPGVMERMKAGLDYESFDANYKSMNLPCYGEVCNSLYFDTEKSSISIFQRLGDAGKNYRAYQPPTTALTDLGFTNYIESDALCEYKDEASDLSIAVNVPAWGSRPDEWENGCVALMKGINGYGLAIWYYPGEQRYVVQADKDDTSAKYQYDAKTGAVGDEYPDPDAVTAQFEAMLGDCAQDDIHMRSIELFQGYVRDTFGMGIDELYALAARA